MTALICDEVPELWQPLAAIAFALSLSEIGKRINYPVAGVAHSFARSCRDGLRAHCRCFREPAMA